MLQQQRLLARQPHRLVAAVAVVAVVTLAGCSSSDSGSGATTGGASASTSDAPVVSSPSQSATDPVASSGSVATTNADNAVRVDAIDSGSQMSYQISGTPNAGLTTITFSNQGHVAHEMRLSRLKNGATLQQFKTLVTGTDPGGELKAQALIIDSNAQLSGPSILGPGMSETVVMPLVAGHYIVACFLPGKNGVPHLAMGMVDGFTVNDSGSEAAVPTTDGTVTLTDHGITVPSGFHGDGTFEIANKGSKQHDFSIAKLTDQPLVSYFRCVVASFAKSHPIDECPGTLSGGVDAVQAGRSVYVTIRALPTAQYGYFSTQGDGADLQAGLQGTFNVN